MLFLLRMQSIRYLEHRGLASVTSPTGATADWREGSTLPAILRTIRTISTAPTSSSRLPASRLELKYLSKIYQIFIKWKLDASLDWVPSLIQTSIISDIHSKYRELPTNIYLVYQSRSNDLILFQVQIVFNHFKIRADSISANSSLGNWKAYGWVPHGAVWFEQLT